MLATLGDLVDDIVVRIDGPMNIASDTAAHITRRQGGSAANVAVAAARRAGRARFIGQVGDDGIGRVLVSELDSVGVDTSSVRMIGTTGTIVVLVDESGERSMLTDRRTCLELGDPDSAWLDGVTALHVPLYSLVDPPLANTATTVIGWANDRGIAVSVDASSDAVIQTLGASNVLRLFEQLRPTVIFANDDEGRALDITGAVAEAITIVKRGPEPAVIHTPDGDTLNSPAVPVTRAHDTTGAGDAFAAGFLTYNDGTTGATPAWYRDPEAACAEGHRAAAELLKGR